MLKLLIRYKKHKSPNFFVDFGALRHLVKAVFGLSLLFNISTVQRVFSSKNCFISWLRCNKLCKKELQSFQSLLIRAVLLLERGQRQLQHIRDGLNDCLKWT